MELIGKLKDTRASGIDNLPTLLFKNASDQYYVKLTKINQCLETGQTPQVRNVGKMTLIGKKEASMQICKKKSPLTVSSATQSIITNRSSHLTSYTQHIYTNVSFYYKDRYILILICHACHAYRPIQTLQGRNK